MACLPSAFVDTFPWTIFYGFFRLRKAFLGRHFLSCVTMGILRMRCQIWLLLLWATFLEESFWKKNILSSTKSSPVHPRKKWHLLLKSLLRRFFKLASSCCLLLTQRSRVPLPFIPFLDITSLKEKNVFSSTKSSVYTQKMASAAEEVLEEILPTWPAPLVFGWLRAPP